VTIFVDEANDDLYVKASTPSSDTDGECLHGCTVSGDTGKVFWGDSATTSYDTGDEVCAQYGLTCDDTFNPSGTQKACGSAWTFTKFVAYCY
jgi:hypothetical protein